MNRKRIFTFVSNSGVNTYTIGVRIDLCPNEHSITTKCCIYCTYVICYCTKYCECCHCWSLPNRFKVSQFCVWKFSHKKIHFQWKNIFVLANRGMAICIAIMFGRLGSVVGANVSSLLIDDHCESVFYISSFTLLGNQCECVCCCSNVIKFISILIHRRGYYGIFYSENSQKAWIGSKWWRTIWTAG